MAEYMIHCLSYRIQIKLTQKLNSLSVQTSVRKKWLANPLSPFLESAKIVGFSEENKIFHFKPLADIPFQREGVDSGRRSKTAQQDFEWTHREIRGIKPMIFYDIL